MYKHVLIAVDGSAEGDRALSQGFALAKALAAKVTVMTATEPWTEAAYTVLPTPSMIRAYEKSATGNAASILNAAKQKAESIGVSCEARHIKDQHAPEAIIKLAREQNCDLIVVGSHGRGSIGRILLGSTSLKVLTFSSVAVLVCR